jgi:ribonuclease HI
MSTSSLQFTGYPQTVHAYVDGSFRPSDCASCAYLLFSEKKKDVIKMASHAHRGSTINQMELMAINHVLDQPNTTNLVIYSDSIYAISALSIWCKGWEKNGWVGVDGNPVKNKDLICEIRDKMKIRKYIKYVKVVAHSGDPYNTIVDYMAQKLSKQMTLDPMIVTGEYSY